MKIGKSSVRVQMTFAPADIDADPHQTVSKRHRWIAALAQILTRWRTREGRERIVLVRGDTSIVAYKRVGQGMTQLSQRTLSETAPSDPYRLVGKTPSVIRLDCDEVLHQKLTLPPDTLDIIRPIVANQLERIMPWEEDEFHYGYRVLGEPITGDAVDVEVVATSKSFVLRSIDDARTLGFEPSRVECTAEHGDETITLHVRTHAHEEANQRVVKATLCAMIAAAILSAGIGLWSAVHTMSTLTSIHQQTAQLDLRAEEAEARISQGARNTALYRQLVAARSETPSATLVLEEITRILPDHTWLYRLDLYDRKIRIFGRSTDTTVLVGAVESSPHFSRAQFSAPNTRTGDDKSITFALDAEVTPVATATPRGDQ